MKSEREARWRELAEHLRVVDSSGVGGLAARDVSRMAKLYRQVTIDLARARARGDDPARIHYLNSLAVRAHSRIYSARRVDLKPALSYFTTGFPQLVRKHWRFIAVATLIFWGTTIATALAVIRDPALAYSLFDERMVEYENIRLEKQQGEYRGNFTFSLADSPFVALAIIANNCFVCIRMFAAGALACIPGLIMLVYNGRMLGTLTGQVIHGGYFWGLYSLIMTHGVLELSAICIAAGAGLQLGWSLIAATDRPRADAIRLAGKDALGLLGGACGILVVAGVIEAHVTPHFGPAVRWSTAILTGLALLAYVGLAGRSPRSTSSASS
jgi:uncharacterized membrane protein SpoIIM required for sporulation